MESNDTTGASSDLREPTTKDGEPQQCDLRLPSAHYAPPAQAKKKTPPATTTESSSSSSSKPSQPPTQHRAGDARGDPPPHRFTFPDELRGWDKPVAAWLRDNDKLFSGIAASAVVFRADGRVLVLQRAPHDSMPLQWEPPGGGVDPGETVLAGCARELWEEAGLVAARVVRVVPPRTGTGTQVSGRREDRDLGVPFSNRTGTRFYYRFTFEVAVDDVGALRIDPEEHVDWMWLTEDEVERCRTEDGREVPFTVNGVRNLLLEAFALRRGGSGGVS